MRVKVGSLNAVTNRQLHPIGQRFMKCLKKNGFVCNQ